MASQTFNNFKNYATQLEKELGIKYDAKPYKDTIRKMLDGFCKAMDEGDEHLKNLYISGLILRHWDKVKKLADSCPNIGIHGEEFVDWVYEAIMYACKYRKWQTDPSVNAQQCINQCIETIRKQHYYEYNLDKHSANYNTVSLDTPIGDESDNGVQRTLEDTMYDEDAEEEVRMADGNSAAKHLIQSFINKDRLVEAIILDIIAFGDTQKVTKVVKKGFDENGDSYKYTSYTHEFWKFKAIQILSNLPEEYKEYFMETYIVKNTALEAALDLLKRANNQKLYKELDRSLQFAKSALSASM
jgi:Ni,Fe-hydrogenase maturation factor